MALEVSTIKSKVKWAFETVAGVRPTSGYETLPDVVEAPDIDFDLTTMDCSNIMDEVTRYMDGRLDPGGTKQFKFNHTDGIIAKWNTICTQAVGKLAEGKRLWFEYAYPTGNNSFYWCGMPKTFGNSGITGNAVSQLTGNVVFNGTEQWQPKSTQIALASATTSVAAEGTVDVNVTNPKGTFTAISTDNSVCTVAVGTGKITISGLKSGVAVVTVKDENLDEASVVVTVS